MSQLMNQFSQSVNQGMLSGIANYNTISAQVDSSESGTLVAGQPVKIVDVGGGVPKVIAAAADDDDIFGFVNWNLKETSYKALDQLEISQFKGNTMWMTAGEAIARNAEVMVVISGVKVATATTGKMVVGRALDKAAADGDLIKVEINLPGELVPGP